MKIISTSLTKEELKDVDDEELFKLMSERTLNEINAEKAFVEFADRYKEYVYGITARRCYQQRAQAETITDITRLTLYKAYLSAHTFKKRHKNSVYVWLSKIIESVRSDYVNDCLNLEKVIWVEEYDENIEDEVRDIFTNRSPIEREVFITEWNKLAQYKRDVLCAYLRHYNIDDFGNNCRLPDYEVQDLLKTYPGRIKDKYYIPKIRDRAYAELYKNCNKNILN